jgi:hypothetical protein
MPPWACGAVASRCSYTVSSLLESDGILASDFLSLIQQWRDAMNEDSGQVIPNYHENMGQRVPCMLVLDASGSMDETLSPADGA